jgi:flagellar hook-length control protein FliK
VFDPNAIPNAMTATDVVSVSVVPATSGTIPIRPNQVDTPDLSNMAASIRPSLPVDMSRSLPRTEATKSPEALDAAALTVVVPPTVEAPLEPAAQSLFDAVVSVSLTRGGPVAASTVPDDGASVLTSERDQPTAAVASNSEEVAIPVTPRGRELPADSESSAPTISVAPSVHGSEHRSSHVQTDATTTTAPTGNVTDHADAVAVAHQIGRHITASRLAAVTREHPTHLSVLLHPEDLGEVSVQLTLVAGRIDVQVSSQSDATRDMLRNGMQDLRRQLSDSGVAVGDMDVNDGWTQQSNSSQNNPQSADQRSNQQSRLPGLPAPSSSRMTTPEPTMVHRPSRTGLDILA